MLQQNKGRLFLVSAPSGAGKTSLVCEVIRRLKPDCSIERVVTYTTKPVRPGEECEGVDYYYLTISQFEKKIAQNFFMEWSNTYGHYYGSPRSVLHDVSVGHSRILIIDRAGAQAIKRQFPRAVMVWIYTKDAQVLRERLARRCRSGDAADQIAHRLAIAHKEIEQESTERLYEHHLLNDSFQCAVSQFDNLVRKQLFDEKALT